MSAVERMLKEILSEQRRQADAISRLENAVANIAVALQVPSEPTRPAHYGKGYAVVGSGRDFGGGAYGGAPNGAWAAAPAAGVKRPRMQENPSQVDTVACVGALEAGFDEAALSEFFGNQPGFIQLKENKRMGGGFIKFESPDLANQACAAAQEAGIPADIAKSSMGLPAAHSGAPQAFHQQPPPMPQSMKRPRPQNMGEVDTVASVGAADVGFDELSLQSFFANLPGFLAFKPNPRMGGGFAKFESASMASDACVAAEAEGVPAAIAKSSMSVVS